MIEASEITNFQTNHILVDSDPQNALTRIRMSELFKHLFREVGLNRQALNSIKESIEANNVIVKRVELEAFLLGGA